MSENVFSLANVPQSFSGVGKGLGHSGSSSVLGTAAAGPTDKQQSSKSKKKAVGHATSRIVVDIVTGQKLVSVFFDPTQSPEPLSEAADHDWLGKNLYVPAAIIKEDESGLLSVRLPSGDVYKMLPGASKVGDQDCEGVEDILQLKEFSEMSLIHTLRVRYARDEIYTFVGPILISINPYKWLKDMYSEQCMIEYHNHKQVSVVVTNTHHPCH